MSPVYPLSDWSVANLRVTAFPAISERYKDLDWWAQVMDAEPEVRTAKTTPAQIEQSGPFEGGPGRLTLSVMPIRTDWLLVPEATPNPWPDSLGPLPDLSAAFVKRIKKWLGSRKQQQSPIHRLAFGAVLHHQEVSREAGYQRICAYLSHTLKVDPSNSSDLLFQVNRFTKSAVVPAMNVNRVNKWAVGAFRLLSPQLLRDPSVVESWSTTLELDLSTPAEHEGPLPDDQLISLLDELVHHAHLVAAEGDEA